MESKGSLRGAKPLWVVSLTLFLWLVSPPLMANFERKRGAGGGGGGWGWEFRPHT